MKPFARKDLSCEVRVLNYRLSRGRRCLECAFGIPTAKQQLLNKTVETNVNKSERIVRCLCLLHHIIIGLEGKTHDTSCLQETLQFRGTYQNKTNVSVRSSSRSSKGAIDVRNAIKA
jgi:thiamine kinase-like enzyme